MVMGLMGALRRDVAAFMGRFDHDGPSGPPPGLQTYRFEVPGGFTRLHLRVQDDGTGLLFRDVTDLLHLSATAAEMAWLALEKTPEHEAVRRLGRRFRGASTASVAADYRRVDGIVRSLADPRVSCHTCALDLPKTPLFATRARAPHKVDIALTYACNNRCPHCYNDPARFDMGSLSVDAWKQVLDRLAEVGVPHVIFTGGEATVYRGLSKLIAHANDLGQIVGLNSNGRRLANRDLMGELAEAGLNHVQITLESHLAAVHDAMVGAGAFEETVAGVQSAIESGVHVITNSTITRLNADTIDDTVVFLRDLGLETFAMNGMIYSGGGNTNPDAIPQAQLPAILVKVRDTAQELGMRFLWYTVTEYCEMSPLELEIGAKRCNAGEYSMCIEPNGDVLPCQSYYTSAGNMLRDPWEQIWKGALFRSFRDREEDPVWAGLPEKCHDCPDLPVCGGGCRIEREAQQGVAPKGCQSCSTGSAPKGRAHRSSGVSAADGRCGCVSTPDPKALVQLRRPTKASGPCTTP
jgi:radical SAM protein with 4Fe4S-binding SPASM domain